MAIDGAIDGLKAGLKTVSGSFKWRESNGVNAPLLFFPGKPASCTSSGLPGERTESNDKSGPWLFAYMADEPVSSNEIDLTVDTVSEPRRIHRLGGEGSGVVTRRSVRTIKAGNEGRMKNSPLASSIAALVFSTVMWSMAGPALAQSSMDQGPAALPTAPAADRAGNGGYTAADASQPGEGGSPLEPYLFLAILAGGGILAGIGGVLTDRRVRIAHGYYTRSRSAPGATQIRAR